MFPLRRGVRAQPTECPLPPLKATRQGMTALLGRIQWVTGY